MAKTQPATDKPKDPAFLIADCHECHCDGKCGDKCRCKDKGKKPEQPWRVSHAPGPRGW